jgi:phosphoribosylformylglycinamidine synthase
MPSAEEVSLDLDDASLVEIGKKGITNKDGERSGPLALDSESMMVIKSHFDSLGRNPTDIEIESLAQTWSEHCKHTIFAAELDEIKNGLFNGRIRKATEIIRANMGKEDICASVFVDNSGGIFFDDKFIVGDKVETHNSPSALDPFGGAITGIVGVNRDAMGFGMAAKPVVNRYGFCFADPKDAKLLYRAKGKKNPILSPARIMLGVIEGVNVGGNCSGIPTPQGFMYFDERYKGKPLVFVGTISIIPRIVNGKNGVDKKAGSGDAVIMVGNRVGLDGIHGATFSSEALSSGSPATAVQIGDPITQKKMSDAIIKEARDRGLYSSITDNGAGGISCSVAEMAKECGGCEVDLEKVPLKYPGMQPWQTWISESQERMTLAVPQENVEEFIELMESRGVEATVIGKFTDSGKCIVKVDGKTIMDIDLEFLHEGLPKKVLKTKEFEQKHPVPSFEQPTDFNSELEQMLSRLNICSREFISVQYDHEVQGSSVLKPLQGTGRVNAETSVVSPVLSSKKGVSISQALYPKYGDISIYDMAACAIDSAIKNLVAVGTPLGKIAILDNFCWCSSDEPGRLWQLKQAAQACLDYAVKYEAPFVSGKDSMFNDFKGFDENNKPLKVSVPPTLLISSFGVLEDASKAVSMDAKFAGDLVYVLGTTRNELGASEYLASKNFVGNSVPKVDANKAIKLYKALVKLIDSELVASVQPVGLGGLGVAIAKKCIAGGLGANIDLSKVLVEAVERNDFLLFSESQSRFIVTVAPENKEKFEKALEGNEFSLVGELTEGNLQLDGLNGERIVDAKVSDLEEAYKKTLRGY